MLCLVESNLKESIELSRIGKLPIAIPEKVEVDLNNNFLVCKGPKGELQRKLHSDMNITVENNEIIIKRPSDSKPHRSWLVKPPVL